jgi:SAM-dependent methyltransferase
VLTQATDSGRYVPAAGRPWLTALYDPAMALTMRTRAFRRALVAAVLAGVPQLVLDVGCGTGTLAAQLVAADPRGDPGPWLPPISGQDGALRSLASVVLPACLLAGGSRCCD